MTDLSKVTYLDIEEANLQEAIDSLDIKKLSKPSKQDQKKFVDAASHYVKKETKMNSCIG